MKDAEDLGLRLQAHVPDFVEEQRAVVRHFEASGPGLIRAGERALFMPEQLAFDEFFGDGGAVHRDHGRIGAPAPGVQGAGGEFLARAVFPGEQYPHVRGGDAGQQFLEFEHDRGLADEFVLFGQNGTEHLIFTAQGARFKGAGRDDDDLFQRKGLFDEIVGPLLDGAYGGLDGSVPRDHHDGQIGMVPLEACLRGEAVHAGQPDVEENEIRAFRVGDLKPFLGGGGLKHFVPFVLQNAPEREPDGFLVVDDQNACHTVSPLFIHNMPLCIGKQFQPGDAREDQPDAQKARRGCRFAEKNDAEQRRAHSPDARPDRVGGADGKVFQGRGQQKKAQGHEDKRRHRRPEPREPVGTLQADGPAYLEQSGQNKQNPVHTLPRHVVEAVPGS